MAAQSTTAGAANLGASPATSTETLPALTDDLVCLLIKQGSSPLEKSEQVLEAGIQLLAIKNAVPHGDFISTLKERIGIAQTRANRMMCAARKFNKETKRHALCALGPTRLFELLAQDDEDLDALASGGTLHGCTLAEIKAMSVKRLRAWLREQAAKGYGKTVDVDRFEQEAKCLDVETFAADAPAAASKVIYLDENHDPDFKLPLQPGDRIRSLHAKRLGSVVRVYHDGSACILWDDGEPQAEGLGHERMPRELLELVKRPDPGAARARRKDYCRELCRTIARYADDAEVTELARALEGVSASILARRYCPGLNAAAYDVFARLGMKGGVQ